MGVVTSTSALCCLNLQVAIEDTTPADLTPGAIRKSQGFMGALMSDRNMAGSEINPLSSKFPGKAINTSNQLPKVEIKYEAPQCGTVSTSVAGLCTNGTATTDPYRYLEVEVTRTRAKNGSFTKDDFQRLCESPDERLALNLRKDAEDLKNAINQDLITLAGGLMGNYSDAVDSSTAPKTINILNGAGHINPAAMAIIKSEFRKMHTNRLPIIVGGDILGVWQDTRMMGGLGANAIGANAASAGGGIDLFVDFEVDTQIQTLLTDTNSHALSWIPGTMYMLDWYRNVGYYEEFKEDYVETTIVIDGITYDYTLRYDECNKRWNYELSKHYDLFCVPDAAYSPCWSFNHKLGWILACGDFDCTQYMA